MREAGGRGSQDYLETWFEDSLGNSPARHTDSGTFIGGHRGVVWIARCLILILANVGAAIGKFKSPHPPPPGYEVDRLGAGLWSRVLRWIKSLTTSIEASNAILAQSANERVYPAEPLVEASPDDLDDDHPTAGPSTKKRRKSVVRKEPPMEQDSDGQSAVLPPRNSKLQAKLKSKADAARLADKGSDDEGGGSGSDDDSDHYQPPDGAISLEEEGADGGDEGEGGEDHKRKSRKGKRALSKDRASKGMLPHVECFFLYLTNVYLRVV